MTKIGVNQYSIGNGKVKLMKQIGSDSKYGTVFMSKGTNEGELYRFAIKVMRQNDENRREIQILDELSKIVLANKNPHFPIIYGRYNCSSPAYIDMPKTINGYKYYISLNEIATGDLDQFMHLTKTGHSEKILLNAMAQIMMAIFSFHRLGYYHNDTHYGNFLYHRINPGGYFKYNIYGDEYYIENLGYLWVIWDFGKAVLMTKHISNTFTRNFHFVNDYCRIIYGFVNEGHPLGGWIEDDYIIPKGVTKVIQEILAARKLVIDNDFTKERQGEKIFIANLIKSNLFKKLQDIPPNSKIINQNAFII